MGVSEPPRFSSSVVREVKRKEGFSENRVGGGKAMEKSELGQWGGVVSSDPEKPAA